ncbi:EamA family transporter RarD [Oryzibacter oryziterrae]|uniref:EamA family transporter RarD n=1 Tax=Oryzibacter oryziterrae TaxID=2766474 RepID=UPI001F0173E5|nr:EamA family transporter RarD [Oryzibacter oryziterrae]
MSSTTPIPTATPTPGNAKGMQGFVFALSAYLMWGFLPFYMKAVAHVPALEVVAQRIVWSLPVGAAVLWGQGKLGSVLAAARNPRVLALGALTAALISVNWLTYVWAIAAGRALETALGYYINPIVNILVGIFVLRERFTPVQGVAVALAVVGVAIMTYVSGGLPWVSLVLALSFAAYGYFKKTLSIGGTEGFLLEILVLTPPALAYVVYTLATGDSHFWSPATGVTTDTWLLMAAGLVTAVPLILFGLGARLLRLSTIGLMQYIAPSMIFLIAIFVFGEPINAGKMIAFGCIWGALALYTSTMFARRT